MHNEAQTSQVLLVQTVSLAILPNCNPVMCVITPHIIAVMWNPPPGGHSGKSDQAGCTTRTENLVYAFRTRHFLFGDSLLFTDVRGNGNHPQYSAPWNMRAQFSSETIYPTLSILPQTFRTLINRQQTHTTFI
ncbi:hypothetical protein P154DRAFT_519899 [Amniculicola lignicola CBS 123094]|uniref:Uncharacterized protein n=1 Tax=Amniculicola lignicola CBS 123094 TaxID=1392246 RepID=A0A6A5WP79_9PLEO|nr:hypothetical protein P154DRAFT_519899 [Amniculicola lignicola CBS 123094]